MRICAGLCFFLTTMAVMADEPRFTAKPVVTRTADQVAVTFAASKATDVEVAVLDAAGKVVRHLAAGVLGANAPATLQKGALKQTLAWDGKDDLGRPAGDGPFRVRVGLGLLPALGSFLGDNPAALGSVRSLAVGPTGEVFVFHVFGALHPSDGSVTCTVFDRDGKYLRTILPYPADLSAERLKGLKRLKREDGSLVPFLYQAETRSLVPGAGDLPPQRAVVTSDGRLAFVGVQEGPQRYAHAGLCHVVVLRTDGGTVEGGFLGTELAKQSSSAASLALSPDEKTLYAVGLIEGKFANKPAHAVYAFGWADRAPRVFAGIKGVAGNDQKHLKEPRGVAVDKDGNVYVADHGNDRVAVFKSDGTFSGALKVDKPERIEVHPKTGAVYVLGGERVDRLQKFDSWEKEKPVAELKLPSFKHPLYTAVMALDASADPPVLWVGSPHGQYVRFDLLRIEDRGAGFGASVDVGRKAADARPTAGPIMGLDLDRRLGRLFVNTQLYDLTAEKWTRGLREAGGFSVNSMGTGSVGLDGNYYSQLYLDVVRRFGPDLKRLPFEATKSDKGDGDLHNPIKGTNRVRGRGVTADPRGNIYVLWEDLEANNRGEAFNHIYVYGPDGALQKAKLVEGGIRGLDSVRVDPAGNVYLALALRPGKDLLPPGLKGQIPEAAKDPDQVGGVNCYPLLYGSIAKFGPKGGVVKKDCGGVLCNYAWGTPVEVKGAEWIFSGASPVVSWRTPGTPDICNCESPRFDVDGFGRSFFPDAARFRVGVLDTSGNLVCWFGSYGNVDSAGKGSRVPTPEIPLHWPYCVSVGDGAAFVGDRLNRRVIRVNLAHAAAETVDVPRK